MKNQTKITITITALLVILLGGYIYNSKYSNPTNDENTSTSTTESIELELTDGLPVEFEYSDDVTISVEPVTQVSNIPDLDRPIVFILETTEDQKTKITKKINEITERLKKDPNSLDDWVNLGANRKLIGDNVGAVEAWMYASEISPLNIVPLNNLGNIYHYQIKDYSKAEEYFKKAVEVGSTYVSSYTNLFELYTLSYKQDTDSAEQILLEGLENNPNQINLLITLATYYRDNGDNKNAITYYEKTAQQAQEAGNTTLYTEIQNQIELLR